MRLDKEICLGGRYNNSSITGIKCNGYVIFPSSDICHIVYTNFDSDFGYVDIYYRNRDGDYEELIGYDYEKALISRESTVGADGLTTTEIYIRNNTNGPFKLHFTAKRVDNVDGFIDYEGAFAYLDGTKSINLSEADFRYTTSMKEFFIESDSLTTINLENIDTSTITDMRKMFYGCISLKNIIGLEHLDTSRVTTMANMFGGSEYSVSIPDGSGTTTYKACVCLTSLDLSNWNVGNVTNMSGMFTCCISLTDLNLDGWDTSNVIDMGSMFSNCKSLTEINIDHFDTSNVTNMSFMFSGCEGLTELDLSNFNTSNVTNMRNMFENCKNITSLDLSNFDTSNVTIMWSMFSGCESLTSLDLSNWNVSNVASTYDMESMFSGCKNLIELNLSGWDTSNITNMSNMFYGCESLTSLDLSDFNTDNVTNMGSMFDGCSGLTELDLSNFNTSKTRYMYSMFSGCSGLTEINLSHWDTSNVTNMRGMFENCSGLTELNLSHFDTKKVWNMPNMFSGCSNLTLLDLSNWNTDSLTSKDNISGILSNCTNLRTLRLDNCADYVIYYIICFGDLPTNNIDGATRRIFCKEENVMGLVPPENWVFVDYRTGEEIESLEMPEGATLYKMGEFYDTDIIEANTMVTSVHRSLRNMFTGCNNLIRVNHIDKWDTKNIVSLYQMFSNCNKLATIDLSSLDTSNVTNMENMFFYCSSLTELDLSNFDTSNVTNMEGMFYSCDKLEVLDLSNFDMTNISYTDDMFGYCSRLHTLKLIECNNATIKEIIGELPTNTIAGETRKIVCREKNAAGLTPPTNWVFEFYDESKIPRPYVPGEFKDKTDIMAVYLLVDSEYTDLSYMFSGCTNLVSINYSDTWDTSNVTNMTCMFYGCENLTELDLSNFDMTNVSAFNTLSMFGYCDNLHTLRLDNCSNDTISKIINSSGFPTQAISGITRKIHCKQTNAAGLTAPTNWIFEYVN